MSGRAYQKDMIEIERLRSRFRAGARGRWKERCDRIRLTEYRLGEAGCWSELLRNVFLCSPDAGVVVQTKTQMKNRNN